MAKAARKKKQLRNPIPWRLLLVLLAIVGGGVGFLVYIATSVDFVQSFADREADRWLIPYWKKPIPPQGPAPETILEPARGIQPENCGVCHPVQYADWSRSFHGKAMGPGLTGQFHTMGFSDEATCLECHAPLSEQWKWLRSAEGKWVANPDFDAGLKGKGLVCAACHLRKHKRHGPPLPQGKPSVSHVVHGQPLRTRFFRASEFCKGCHQHPTTSLIINGKTVENTYQEWLRSPYAARGVVCQDCHMPGKRHLWKGIHDPEMTRSGVTFTTVLSNETPAVGETFEAVLKLENTGTGHAFPTYTTPAVFLKAAFLDAEGGILQGGYYEQKILQRRLDMSVSPWGEKFDTRVPPGESAQLKFSHRVPAGAHSVYLWVWVEPDHFYTGFYKSYLRGGRKFKGAEQLAAALKNSLDSQYLLFSRIVPVLAAKPAN